MKMIAIIGYGKIAKDQHGPSIAETEGLQCAATVSTRGDAPDGIPSFPTLEALASSGLAIDAIVLCTPPDGRVKLAMAAINFGWDILLEKPPGATVLEVQMLADYAAAAGRVLFTAWHCQYNAAVEAAASRLAAQTIISLRIDWKEDVRKWHPGQDWIWQPGGFGVFDPGINALSIATKIVPVPLIIDYASLFIADNHQTPIVAEIGFAGELSGKGAAYFDWRGGGDEIWQIAIETETETLLLDKGGSDLWIDDELVITEKSMEYRLIYTKFAEMLRARRSLVDLRPLQLVADAFLLSHRHRLAPFGG